MNFWQDIADTPFDDLFDRDDLSLEEILDQECVLLEFRNRNPRLIALYLPHHILVSSPTSPPYSPSCQHTVTIQSRPADMHSYHQRYSLRPVHSSSPTSSYHLMHL